MSTNGAYARGMRQEDVSLHHLQKLFSAYGWPVERMVRDLGEDLFVRIYDNGSPSGLSFFAQAKSTKSLDSRRVRKGSVTYRLDVQHMIQWGVSYLPVVVIVWGVVSQKGCWVCVADAVDGS